MATSPPSVFKKKACGMEGQSFRARLIMTPQGHSAHHWVGEQQIPVAEKRLSSNVFVPRLLPQLLAYSALQKAIGGWRDGAKPLVPIRINSQAGILHKHLPQVVDGP